MVDGQRALFVVNGAPADAQHLAAAQAVVGRQLDHHRDGVILRGLEQGGQFLPCVESRQILALLGPVHLVSHIPIHQTIFHGVLESLTHHGVVVDDGIGTTSVSEDGAVQFPDVLGLQFPQPQAPRPEKGIQPGGDELRREGYKLASLAIVDEMGDNGSLKFRKTEY